MSRLSGGLAVLVATAGAWYAASGASRLSTGIAVLVAVAATGCAALKYGLYDRVYANGLGFSSEPSDVFRVTATSSLKGRTALVTGCKEGGIGFETVFALANAGAHVFVHTRSLESSRATIAALLQRNGSLQLTPIAADLADLDDVARMAREIPQVALDFLFLNGGIMYCAKRQTTAQNIEMYMGVNHVAHALLAIGLLPQLRRAKGGARVITVASDAYAYGEVAALSSPTLESATPWSSFGTYMTSKLANVVFAVEFDRRCRSENIRAVPLNPGIYASTFRDKLKSEETGSARLVVWLFWVVDRVMSKTITQVTSTSLYAALGPAALGGTFLEHCQPKPLSSDVTAALANRELVDTFWRNTLGLIGARLD